MRVALFGKKKGGGGEGDGEGVGEVGGGVAEGGGDGVVAKGYTHDPEKAQKFFDHARAMHETMNFAYAMTLWLQGMRFDPQDMNAFESFFESADNFMASGKAKGATKEQKAAIEGKGEINRYLQSLLAWGAKRSDWKLGLRAMEAGAKLGLDEQVHWMGGIVLAFAANDKKAKKGDYVALMEALEATGAYEQAERAGAMAVEQDPQDAKLIARVKNMSAEAAMSRGGFEGQGGVSQGHFRRNIKDAAKQKELEEEESLSKDEATLGRLIERERERVKANPDDQDAWGKLLRHLRERGTEADESRAYKLAMKAHEKFGSFRWREAAGDIKLRVAHRKVRGLREAASADPSKKGALAEAERKLLEMEVEEFGLREEAYPTDLKIKYEYGKRLFAVGRYEEAVERFQRAKDASGIANRVRLALARSFTKMGWLGEAEDTFRQAIEGHGSAGDRLALELRYGLMEVLESLARDEGDMERAKEALELAGKIAMQDFSFRDIKDRRTSLQGLVNELKAG